jgi:hypothetical protein
VDQPGPDPRAVAEDWLVGLARTRAEAVSEGAPFSERDLELVEIGIVAGASEMLTLLDELGLLRPPP